MNSFNTFPGKSKVNPLDKSLAKPKTEVCFLLDFLWSNRSSADHLHQLINLIVICDHPPDQPCCVCPSVLRDRPVQSGSHLHGARTADQVREGAFLNRSLSRFPSCIILVNQSPASSTDWHPWATMLANACWTWSSSETSSLKERPDWSTFWFSSKTPFGRRCSARRQTNWSKRTMTKLPVSESSFVLFKVFLLILSLAKPNHHHPFPRRLSNWNRTDHQQIHLRAQRQRRPELCGLHQWHYRSDSNWIQLRKFTLSYFLCLEKRKNHNLCLPLSFTRQPAKVTVHWHKGTTFMIKFEDFVIQKDKAQNK